MKLFRKPWIWVARFRKRKGYGVHSPFAYSFIRGVVLETSAYYAYAELAQLHPWWVRWGRLYPMMCRRLLFRLANYAEPKTVVLLTKDKLVENYVRAAVPRAEMITAGNGISAGKPQSTLTAGGGTRNADFTGGGARNADFTGGGAQADFTGGGARKADFVFIGKEFLGEAVHYATAMPSQGMLVCEGIHKDHTALEIWRTIQKDEHTGITFDLYTYGVAFFNHALHKQHYKVNF